MKLMKATFVAILLIPFNLWSQSTLPCACCTPEARQFDFWVGVWETYQADGKLAGNNTIIILQDGCVLQENWISSGGGYTGTSYNFYNSRTKKWRQLWIDYQGGNLQLTGELINGNMVLQSEKLPNQKGEWQIDRITWTPNKDGSVRQHWEASTDDGKTWTTAFDGLYKKVK
jgi:hypothetical protein